jgi:hypothetical protein
MNKELGNGDVKLSCNIWMKWSKTRSCRKHFLCDKTYFHDARLLREYLECVIQQINTGHCFYTILNWFRITDSVSSFLWDTALKIVRFVRSDASLFLSRAFKVSRNVQNVIMRTQYTTKKIPHISTERKYVPFPCQTQVFTKRQL